METRLTIEMDQDEKNQLKGKAALEGKTLKEKIIELIRKYLRDE